VLASEEAAKNLKPLARLVGWSFVGVDPSIMGIGPVPAIQNLLKATNLTLNDIDLVEVSSLKRECIHAFCPFSTLRQIAVTLAALEATVCK
jgi:hypothetical protein